MKKIIVIETLLTFLLLYACSSGPSDKIIEEAIRENAKKTNWQLNVPGEVYSGDVYEVFLGSSIKINNIEILAKSFNGKDGLVKLKLEGEKKDDRHIEAWYGESHSWALKQGFISNTFTFEGEWSMKKYDTGWIVNEETKTANAYFTY